MKSLSSIDKNFKVETKIDKPDIQYYNVLEEPFEIFGIFHENGKFRRIPEKLAKVVSRGVNSVHTNTSGGRVRFKTDSPYVAISAKMDGICFDGGFSMTGIAGFDLYVRNGDKDIYYKSFTLPESIENGYESVLEFTTKEMREITINFPLYSNVCELYIGISNECSLKKAERLYKDIPPVVYYGSSITQGGCASKPGNSYPSMISRWLNCDYINLGFSGSAGAEKVMADYIKNLDMSVFVYDYDHNAPDPEFLQNTHEAMFKTIREVKPDLPIIIMSRPKIYLSDIEKERMTIIKSTYDNAKAAGDENVYFIPGPKLMELTDNDGSVDTVHPNDLGFYSMAKAVCSVLEKII